MRVASQLSLRAKLVGLVLVANTVAMGAVAVLATRAARARLAVLEERVEHTSYHDELRDHLRAKTKHTVVFMATMSTLTLVLSGLYALRASRGIARSVGQLREAASKLAAGSLDVPVQVEGEDEFAQLAQSLETMRCELRKSLELLSQKAALERDLALGATFQSRFLPRTTELQGEQFGLVAYYRPAARCSGDFWYSELLPDGRRLVMVGDVTGHGPAPALVTSAVATAVRCAQQTNQLQDVNALLETLDQVVHESGGGQFLMTLSVLRFDPASGKVEWWSTGGPALMKSDVQGEISFVQALGTPLGTAPARVGFAQSTLGIGERLLVVTDGILEAQLPNGRPVGVRRLRGWLSEAAPHPLVAAREHIHHELLSASAADVFDDDITFVLLERLAPSELRRSA